MIRWGIISATSSSRRWRRGSSRRFAPPTWQPDWVETNSSVIQTHLAVPAAAGVLAEKLVEELGRTYVLEDQEVQSGASIGIAIYPNDAEDPAELIKHADLALYEAKHRGRFNYQFYRDELGEAFRKAQRLETGIGACLAGKRVFPALSTAIRLEERTDYRDRSAAEMAPSTRGYSPLPNSFRRRSAQN